MLAMAEVTIAVIQQDTAAIQARDMYANVPSIDPYLFIDRLGHLTLDTVATDTVVATVAVAVVIDKPLSGFVCRR